MNTRDFDNLPLFADDAAIGRALLGPARAGEWRGIVELLERKGFPKIDDLMGGRYVPAIRAYFDRQYGVGGAAPDAKAPDGVEDLSKWKETKRAGRRGPA